MTLDGTDNFPTRFLLNDAAIKHGRPWIFGASLAAKLNDNHDVTANEYLVRAITPGGRTVIVFADGRATVQPACVPAEAAEVARRLLGR